MTRKALALLPLILILVLILILYLSGAYTLFNFETIQQEHLEWRTFVHVHPLLSAIYFIGIYVVSVMLVIPDSTILTILGGFLFPLPLAITYTCIGETIGGTLFFLATRIAFVETLGQKKKRSFRELEKKFHDNQVCYLLFLRYLAATIHIGDDLTLLKGLEESIKSMQKGEKARFHLKPNYGYGPKGNEALGVPPDASLEYDIELVDFEKVSFVIRAFHCSRPTGADADICVALS